MRPGVHLLLVEPRMLSGWAVASQHESCAGAARPRAQRQRWVGSVRSSYRPPWTENHHRWGSRREGGGVSLQPPRLPPPSPAPD
jgi:hypothetical protein